MVAYEKALDWQELFDLVLREGVTGDKMSIIAHRMAGISLDFFVEHFPLSIIPDELGSKQRHAEAARVLLDYTGDVDEAISSLVSGDAWSEARRIVSAWSSSSFGRLSLSHALAGGPSQKR